MIIHISTQLTKDQRQTGYLLVFLLILACLTLLPINSFADETQTRFARVAQYASIANATYLSQTEAQKVIEAQGYKLTEFKLIPGVEVSYLVATNDEDKHHIIAVRGTDNVENAIIDISLKLQMDKHSHIPLHEGFALSAENIYAELLPRLKKGYSVSTTGHSLGGAVALILAMYLDMDKITLGPVITFGQPKVTNISGALAFQHLDVTRMVTEQDLVPLVPPLDPLDINNLDIYWHLGKEIVLLPGKDYAELKGVKSMMRATRIINKIPDRNNLEHHRMAQYLKLIEGKVENAQQVPYDSSVNVFKLFGQ